MAYYLYLEEADAPACAGTGWANNKVRQRMQPGIRKVAKFAAAF